MIHLIRAEVIKFRSVRSTVVLLTVAGALVVLIAVLQARDINGKIDDGLGAVSQQLGDLTGGVALAVFLFGALGVQVIGQEYRFNTIRTTLAAAPIRWKVLTAKLVVTTVACAAMSALMLGACALIGSTMLDGFGIDGTDRRLLWAVPLFAAGWSAMGLGVGAIVRQPIAGILILLGEAFVAENILVNLFPRTVPWLPFANGVQMAMQESGAEGSDEVVLRSMLAGGVYFFVVTAVVLAIGTYLATQRDA
jgi:ABC-type transport system involved in multi-copper enzyme maturation permease subunit